jgi:hypothetical protein
LRGCRVGILGKGAVHGKHYITGAHDLPPPVFFTDRNARAAFERTAPAVEDAPRHLVIGMLFGGVLDDEIHLDPGTQMSP